MNATLFIALEGALAEVPARLFGSFVEHLGRAVYGGVYEPGHPTADAQGFRGDVQALVRELGVPVIRYPGGNFVSGYNWEDGIGDKAKRPSRLELAWGSLETNQVGVGEFAAWTRSVGAELMMAVNLGTRGAEDARHLVEYCNGTAATPYAELRRQNGSPEPFGVKLWCLGNEMDGPWQICQKTAAEYARLAKETAKVMKWTDPEIELVACGSSHHCMPTFGAWERTVLRECWEHVDYLSLHNYYGNPAGDVPAFLASSLDMDAYIRQAQAICDEIRAQKHSDKIMMLSFDEWNVWYHSNQNPPQTAPWSFAPPLLEDVYDLADALVVGTLLVTLLNHADRVKIACLAQLVNAIAPIMTETGGRAWRQTIFYPYLHALRYARGEVLRTLVSCPGYATQQHAHVPYLESAAVRDGSTVTVFAVNRHLTEPLTLSVCGLEGYRLAGHITLTADDLSAVNTADHAAVLPAELPLTGKIVLPCHSWNVLRFVAN